LKLFYFSEKLEALEEKVKKGDDTLGRKTLADDLDNKPTIMTYNRDGLTESDLYPTFIVVQVLERGQYFVSKSFVIVNKIGYVLFSDVRMENAHVGLCSRYYYLCIL
jgi:hypothetical protein